MGVRQMSSEQSQPSKDEGQRDAARAEASAHEPGKAAPADSTPQRIGETSASPSRSFL
jgi:hypothetical protein